MHQLKNALPEKTINFVGRLGGLVLLAVIFWTPTQAQTTGSLSGIITDEQGAVVPGAAVSVFSIDQSQTAGTAQTTDDGTYNFPALIPGTYRLLVEQNGFKKTEVSPVIIELSRANRVDVKLSVGSVDATVDVQLDSRDQIDRDSSGVGITVDKDQVKDLPLFERDPSRLISLSPGVSTGTDTDNAGNVIQQLSVNGSRSSNNEVTVDGISAVNGSTGGATFLPSVEALREFRIQTSAYSAEFGRTSGGTISAVIDSGTKDYHGSLYEYFRNEKLNANDYFNNSRSIVRGADRYNQFGGKLGGQIPLIRKTFFFFNYEGSRRTVPRTATQTVPTEAFRNGDFSSSLGNYLCSSGPSSPNPSTCSGTAAPVMVTNTSGTSVQARAGMLFRPTDLRAYVGNIIPQIEWDPAAAAILSHIPTPTNSSISNNYVRGNSQSLESDQITTRVDHNLTANSRIFGRYSYRATTNTGSPNLDSILDSAQGPSDTLDHQLALGYNQTFSPTIFNEFNFGYGINKNIYDPPHTLESPSDLGFQVLPQLEVDGTPTYYPPVIAISNYSQLGIQNNTLRRQNTYVTHINDAVTIIRGGHTIKAGAQVRLNLLDIFNGGADYAGNYTIQGNVMPSPVTQIAAQNNRTTAFAAFLLGRVTSARYQIPQQSVGRKNYNVGFFVQDDWKFWPNLTLNLGLRWDYEAPMTVEDNIYSRVDPETGMLLVAGQNASPSLNLTADKDNFGPRVGFAYSYDQNTVFRAGYGLFYGQNFSNLGAALFPGFTLTNTFGTRSNNQPQLFSLAQGVPLITDTNVDPMTVWTNATPQNPLAPGPQYSFISPLAETHSWNVGIQRALPWGVILNVAYVGSRSTHLPLTSKDFNAAPMEMIESLAAANSAVASQNARPFPNIGSISGNYNEGSSTYHSGQFTVTRRFQGGLGFNANYTWSKSMDNGSALFSGATASGNDRGLLPTYQLDWALSSLDRPHVFTASVQYALPFGKGKRFLNDPSGIGWKVLAAVLGGWQVNTLTLLRSGNPDTIFLSGTQTSNIGQGYFNPRPNTNGDPLQIVNQPGPNGSVQWFQVPGSEAFPYTPVGPLYTGTGASRTQILPFEIGNVGRNTVRSPNAYKSDISVVRRFRVGERMSINVKAEAFNVFNQTTFTFDTPYPLAHNAAVVTLPVIVSNGQAIFDPNSSFGRITSSLPARKMQLVARFEF